jgi:hypothetical protein
MSNEITTKWKQTAKLYQTNLSKLALVEKEC